VGAFVPPTGARGTSLVEVVIALGLLAGLLISVAGLIALGNRQISGGALASRALVVAQSILEALELDAYHRTYSNLLCDASLATCRVGSGQAVVGDWHALAAANLPAPVVEVRVDAVGAPSLHAAPALRISVVVSWQEGVRSRRLRLTTLRV
jgi:hypothetical protein